jgi:hypothetical protein
VNDADRWVNPGEEEECQPGDQDCDGFDLVSNWCVSMDSTEADFTFYSTAAYTSWGGFPSRMDALRDGSGRTLLPVQVMGYGETRWKVQFQPFPADPLIAVDDYTGDVLYTGGGSKGFGRPTSTVLSMLASDTYYRAAVAPMPIVRSVDIGDVATTFLEGPEVTPVGPGHDARPLFGAGIAEDVDGDGLDEVFGATWGAPVETAGAWASPLPSGTLTIDDMSLSWAFDHTDSFIAAGTSGDLDDDGYADVVLLRGQASGRQQIEFFRGANLLLAVTSPTADSIWMGEGTDDELAPYGGCGNAVSSGQHTALVGAPNFGRTWDGAEGTLYLVDDRAVSGTIDLRDVTRIRSSVRGDGFGQGAACGDFNGDGFTDVVVGAATAEEHGEINVGELDLFYGPMNGDLDAGHPHFQITGDRADANDMWFGASVTAGDFDGDGVDDIAATGQIQQRFFLGSTY